MNPAPPARPDKERPNPWDELTKPPGRRNHESQGGETPSAFSRWPSILSMAAVLGLIACVAWSRRLSAGRMETQDIVYALALTLLVGALIWNLPRRGYLRAAKQALLWAGVFLTFVLGYAYRAELGVARDRVMAALVPGRGMASAEGAQTYEMAKDGHFYVQAGVNGLPVLFLADTGATNVVLTKFDAERIGLDANALNYDERASTANGIVRGARITLDALEVGDFVLNDFPASVNDSELDTSLLGMSFFSRLESYKIEGKTLVLKWRKD